MFNLDYASRQPIYEQIYNNVIRMSALGVYKKGDKLPPVRVLAIDLGINPNTVAKAYTMLEHDGYIYSAVGKGSFISGKLTSESAERLIAIDKVKAAVKAAVILGASRDDLVRIIDDFFKTGG